MSKNGGYFKDGWFYEVSFNASFVKGFKVTKHLHVEQSKYQKIEVLETQAVGKLLLLDGCTMVSDKDEFIYHEVMAHIPYMASQKCENILIIGGGDGGIVREFVKHQDIKKIDLIEIDQRVIEVTKEYFPDVASGLDDPRVNIVCVDGVEFIKSKTNEYDVIIIDSTDPVDFASGLFTEEFYENVFNALTDRGIMMNQTENPFLDEFNIKEIYASMRKIFKEVHSFAAPITIYPGTFWTFGFSSKTQRPINLDVDKIQSMQKIQKNLKWYNMDWHKAAFTLSNFQKKAIGLEV
jgi:spermidine synthase